MIIKCKMCGGDLVFMEGSTVCECEFCGTQQTVPVLDNEKKMNLFNRANRLRMNAEFDKAAAVYASITAEFPEEAEAYWGLCLCKYGIEYVDDPATGNKIPTCHRTLPESIMDDSDFDQACENADPIAKKLYREEAKAIDRLQRDILDIVAKETPYDVFICYKETGEDGARTEDSVLAQDIYDKLTEKGLKVFFARITLEDKLGQQYEPYIYAALHSAKVMLAIGTQFEYFDAVWVKNEWARFLDMMKSDRSKTLIPCYRGIDAYDMPREFKNLQAQDMGKLGWLQDLTRGVLKLCGKEDTSTLASSKTVIQQVVQGGNPTVDSLLQRAFMFLEDGDWESGAQYADKVLDIEPTNGRAYLVKLMAELHAKNRGLLANIENTFENNANYQKVLRFGDESLRDELQSYIGGINERNHNRQKEMILEKARKALITANTEDAVQNIVKDLETIQGFAGVEEVLAECNKRQNQIGKWPEVEEKVQALYDQLKEIKRVWTEQEQKIEQMAQVVAGRRVKAARDQLEALKLKSGGINRRIVEKRAELDSLHGLFTGKKRTELQVSISEMQNTLKKVATERDEVQNELQRAEQEVAEAKEQLNTLKESINSKPEESEFIYQAAKLYYDSANYIKAYREYQKILDYQDVNQLLNDENLAAVAAAHETQLKPYKTVGGTVTFGHYEQDNNTGNGKEPIEWIVLDANSAKSLLISKYALDAKAYNDKLTDITWEKSTLRSWLNSTFINNAFSGEEQKAILTTNVDNSDAQGYSGYKTRGGNNTQDKIFLLSYAEAWKYFKSDSDRTCTATAYANSQGAYNADNGNCWWRLRSPGFIQNNAGYVYHDGSRNYCFADSSRFAIRPAFWLNLEALDI